MNMLCHMIFGAGMVIHPNTYSYIQESEKKLQVRGSQERVRWDR